MRIANPLSIVAIQSLTQGIKFVLAREKQYINSKDKYDSIQNLMIILGWKLPGSINFYKM
ncbi:hypothetical protein VIN01S_17520 [Vibrio inusitatus NBRC 102082]|uniref:Uncharacterized protein n=1 Tax=Vibrio inusitatus NBRC 102082 TaxID=1219070 RepID=A0A4Y3HV79_9VIBR|nr:hypothetical protein VIN01S_17520 [Vibrio inusitatus NBRC 102082]